MKRQRLIGRGVDVAVACAACATDNAMWAKFIVTEFVPCYSIGRAFFRRV
jgi:hypothetical protein